MMYESLEQIIILRKDSLIIILISGLVVRTDMRTFYNLFHFLEYLASFTHDGVKVLLELFYKGRIVVVYLLDDKGKDVPCIIDIDTVMRQLVQGVFSQIVDVFCLQRHLLVVFHRMEMSLLGCS